MNSEKIRAIVPSGEQDQIDRKMLVWVNNFPDKPVKTINYESLAADAPGMALSSIQTAYITRRYLLGGYQAEYQFKLIYRIKSTAGPAGNDSRLSADELLNSFGDWAYLQKPDIGEGFHVIRVEPMSRSSLFAAYGNNEEDHQILMKMTYERMV